MIRTNLNNLAMNRYTNIMDTIKSQNSVAQTEYANGYLTCDVVITPFVYNAYKVIYATRQQKNNMMEVIRNIKDELDNLSMV